MEKLILSTVFSTILAFAIVATAKPTEPSYLPFNNSIEITTQKTMAESKKGKLQLIYFWASWCPDCKDKFKKDLTIYQNPQVDFFTLSIEENKEKVLKFISKEDVKYPVFYDSNRQLQKELKVFSVPTVVLTKTVAGKLEVIHQVSGPNWEEIDSAIQNELKKM